MQLAVGEQLQYLAVIVYSFVEAIVVALYHLVDQSLDSLPLTAQLQVRQVSGSL